MNPVATIANQDEQEHHRTWNVIPQRGQPAFVDIVHLAQRGDEAIRWQRLWRFCGHRHCLLP
jgi:hypothetical protein